MPVVTYDNGTVVASRVIVCRTCESKIKISTESVGRPEHSPSAHILIDLDHALAGVASALGWANVDELNRADCPRHKVA